MKSNELRDYIKKSTAASGVPLKVSDKSALAVIVTLLA